MIARVETLVKMGQISRATVHMNLSLAVVGLINGYVAPLTQDLSEDYIDSFAPKYGDKFKIPNFFEDMVYNPREGVMMVGTYTYKEEAKKKGNEINNVWWWFKTWFYQHGKTAFKNGQFVEYNPTREY
ncbi:unnamed protein product [Brassica rapa]|uniref:Uncharacterized protein n=3 Tax=Brassica TaxID=3705 RepID=A0A8D9GLJ2_BRACM|nr:unnamed protein product [Brassica napus]CAG7882830.1 unnamed protein product [Brassica rapa]